MCRLYGLQANEPTRVECSLVHAQNALMAQSRLDTEGLTHGHGWGIAVYPDGVPHIEKQAWAAWHGEHFRRSAARAYSRLVIAHVRRATIGPPGMENTHPFHHGVWVFAHNGTLPNFEAVRGRMLEATDDGQRVEIRGATDSEHIFRYLISLWERDPGRSLMETLRLGVATIAGWCREVDANARIGLNLLWSDGVHLVGSRIGRTLWYLEREGIVPCEICGASHVHHEARTDYRAVEVASEPITHEDWKALPDGTVFAVDPDMALHIEPIEEAVEAA